MLSLPVPRRAGRGRRVVVGLTGKRSLSVSPLGSAAPRAPAREWANGRSVRLGTARTTLARSHGPGQTTSAPHAPTLS
eukprot:3269584-Pyramimonas_sp.AAC.1